MNYKLTLLEKDNLSKIKHLWKKLNKFHLEKSNYFKDHYENFTFEKRCEKFRELEENNIRIEVFEINETIAGYCIATITNNVGEVDSIFIDEEYRDKNYGTILLNNSIKWLEDNKCDRLILAVSDGNESVFNFYNKHGFYPRLTYMQKK